MKKILKKTIELSLPLIIGQLGQMMMGVVDSMMVGHFGAVELAASAIGNGLFMLVLIFGSGVTIAVSPIVAKENGAKNFEKVGRIFDQSILLTIFIGLILTPLAYFGTDAIKYLNQKPDVEILAISYGKILALSTMPFLLFSTLKSFIEGVSIVKPAMKMMLFANILNAFINWILVFGNFGFEPMGLDGAGYATLSTRTFLLLAIIFYIIFSKKLKKFELKFHFKKLNSVLVKKILSIGVPSGTQYLFEGGAFILGSFLVGMIGKYELAAHQIAINLASITYMIYMGISMASAVQVAGELGKNNRKEAQRAGFAALIFSLGIMIISGLIFIVFNTTLPTFYNNETTVLSIASTLLIYGAAFQVSDGIQAVLLGILRGYSDMKLATKYTFFSYWIVLIPMSVWLGLYTEIGVEGVWISFLVGLTISALLLSLRFLKISR
jgi:MATE family multidrug resistance protein